MDQGYVNARIRGMHSRLLDHKTLSNLILLPDLNTLVNELEKTQYRQDLEHALTISTGITGIEAALRNNLVRTLQKIHWFVQSETSEKYIRIFSSRWDIQNLKTILRGKKNHIPPQEIRDNLVPAGKFDDSLLTELFKQPDLKSVIDLLATWEHPCAVPLTNAMPEFGKKADLVILEYALDKYYYSQSLEMVAGKSVEESAIRDLIGIDIDTINIKNILMMVRDQVDPEFELPVLLEGGKVLTEKELKHLIRSENIGDIISFLQKTPYRFLSDLRSEREDIKISAYESLLDRHLLKQATKLYRMDPLSITVIIGYLWTKYNEIINLRIIARCKDAMILPEDVETELNYV